jgi:hypothetical protein
MVRISKPRCILVYALAPDGTSAATANRQLNAFVADPTLPLVLFHDHFIGQPGGIAIFFVESAPEWETLETASHLPGWQVELRPLIFSRSPAAFDEQIAFTLRSYRGRDWEALQHEQRPIYGNPQREAEIAAEEDEH